MQNDMQVTPSVFVEWMNAINYGEKSGIVNTNSQEIFENFKESVDILSGLQKNWEKSLEETDCTLGKQLSYIFGKDYLQEQEKALAMTIKELQTSIGAWESLVKDDIENINSIRSSTKDSEIIDTYLQTWNLPIAEEVKSITQYLFRKIDIYNLTQDLSFRKKELFKKSAMELLEHEIQTFCWQNNITSEQEDFLRTLYKVESDKGNITMDFRSGEVMVLEVDNDGEHVYTYKHTLKEQFAEWLMSE